MKKQANWFLIPAVALGLGACQKKAEVKTPEAQPAEVKATPGETPAKETPPAVVPAVPQAGAEERAAKLGFVRYLPQDTEVVLSFYNGAKVADRVRTSEVWKLVDKAMNGSAAEDEEPAEEEEAKDPNAAIEDADEAANEAMDAVKEAVDAAAEAAKEAGEEMQDDVTPEEPKAEKPRAEEPKAEEPKAEEPAADAVDAALAEDEEADPMSFAKLFGTEVTLAMGKTTGEQLGNLMTVNGRMSYFHMRGIAKVFAETVISGDSSGLNSSILNNYSQEIFKEVLSDPKGGIDLVEKAKMPPIYLAFRTAEAERAGAATQVASMLENLGMLGEMVEPVTAEVGGNKFTGTKILGSKMAASMEASRSSMDAMLGAPVAERLLADLAKKDIVILSGNVGDYTLVFMGGSTADLKLAEGLGQSIVSGDALAFSDGYLSKDLAAISYGQKEAMETLVNSVGGLQEITNGLRDGLAGAEGLGEMRELDAMFQIVAERETALKKLAVTESSGIVAFFEEGLKIESFGGTDQGMIDWKAPHTFAALGESEDVFLFADTSGNAIYDEKASAYVEAIVETAYAFAVKVTEAPIVAKEFTQFQEGFKLFDTKFRPDLLGLWDAYSKDFSGSLGNELAFVMDLKGGAPAIPGMPQALLDKAKVPRISFVMPVTDRTKISGSWDKMNTSLTSTLTKISDMTGTPIPMQKPMSSERDGNVTWFFPMPFLTDDFVPSVTVGDKFFAASTSKNQALDLIAKAGTPGPARDGFWLSMNFKTLEKYASEALTILEENAESMSGEPLAAKDKKTFRELTSILTHMDKMTFHFRREGQTLRSSTHFKTR